MMGKGGAGIATSKHQLFCSKPLQLVAYLRSISVFLNFYFQVFRFFQFILVVWAENNVPLPWFSNMVLLTERTPLVCLCKLVTSSLYLTVATMINGDILREASLFSTQVSRVLVHHCREWLVEQARSRVWVHALAAIHIIVGQEAEPR